jgi:D-3-phosphoglycerate dehydrogenase
MRIVLCYPVQQEHLVQIQAAAPRAEIVDAGQEHIAQELFAADIYCGHAKVPVDWDGVVRQGRLRWIQSSAAGMDHCLTPSVVASEITVTSASGVLADQVTEHALALTTYFLRSLPRFIAGQAQREFIRLPTRDLHDATVGLIGFGGNGRRMAEVLRFFRCRILAVDMFPVDKPDYVEALWPPERVDEVLSQCDIVMLHVPLTDKTRDWFDATRLAKIKPGAIFINVARGPIVVESALVDALRNGALHAAGLDVTYEEPLAKTSQLWDLPNCLITPHVGGQSKHRIEQMTDFFCENLRRYQMGEPLNNLIDKQLGFPVRSRPS